MGKKKKKLMPKYRITLVLWCLCFVLSSLFCVGNLAAATDKASFVSENYPDNTKVPGGKSFTKTWTIKNTGTSTWTSSYKLKYVSYQGARLSSTSEVKISGSVSPGKSYTFSVPMKAPAAQSSEKSYKESWKFTNPSGSTINIGSSSTVWVLIKVPAALTDKAGWVKETIPDNTVFPGGTSFTKTWTIKNTGTSTWTSSYKLKYVSYQGARLSSTSEVKISGSVSPGNSYTFSVPMKAPAAQSSEKSYKENWKFTNASGSTINIGSSSTVWVLIKVPAAGGVPGDNASKGVKNASDNLYKTSGYVTWNGVKSHGIWADGTATYCARFSRMCYGEPARFADAISMYDYFKGKNLINTGTTPPAGAVVFYAKHSENGNYGHTGIAVGGGKLYSVTSRSTGVNPTSVIGAFKAAYLGYVTADTFIQYH